MESNNEILFVDIQLVGNTHIYEPIHISFGDNCVFGCSNSRNLSFLLGYCSKEEAEIRKKSIQE